MTTQRKLTKNEKRGLAIVGALAACALFGICGGIVEAIQGDNPSSPRPVATASPTGTNEIFNPVSDAPPTAGPEETAEPEETHAPASRPSKRQPEPENDSVYYPNCAAARADGAAPLHRGDPGYSRKLDRDGDGTACE